MKTTLCWPFGLNKTAGIGLSFLLYAVALFSPSSGMAQTEENGGDISSMNEMQVIPPSPNVAAFNKYVDIPVNYYTGTAQIDIPLHAIQLNQINVPISLSYAASGIKVEEIPSWAGAGWTLNATGAISRTVRGLHDEFLEGGVDDFSAGRRGFFSKMVGLSFGSDGVINHTKLTDCINDEFVFTPDEPVTFLDSLTAGFFDTQPDLYHYSFPGGSGKFVFKRNRELMKLSVDDNKITNHPYSGYPFGNTDAYLDDYVWEILGEDGVRYTYSQAERTEVNSQCGYTNDADIQRYQSSWYLRKIDIADEWVEFNYVQEDITYITRLSESRKVKVSGDGTQPEPSFCLNNTSVKALRLQSIVSSKGDSIAFKEKDGFRADLAGSKALEEVHIFKNGFFVKKYLLETGYFGSNKKLKLLSVKEIGREGLDEMNPHVFEYFEGSDFPAIDSRSQDHLGYYNGAGNNYSMIPSYRDDTYYLEAGEADRRPNLSFTKVGALKRITYPTKGYVDFNYELHEYFNAEAKVSYDYSVSAEEGTFGNPVIVTKEFEVPQSCSATLFQDNQGDSDVDGISRNSYSQLRKWSESKQVYENYILSPNAFGNRAVLPAGKYQLYAQNSGDFPSVSIKIAYEQEGTSNLAVGGLRLKSLNFYNKLSSTPVLSKHFVYYQDTSLVSSGVLFTPIAFGGNKTTYIPGSGSGMDQLACISEGAIEYINLSESTHLPLAFYQGSPVGYSKVRVYEKVYDALLESDVASFNPYNLLGENGCVEYSYINDRGFVNTGSPAAPSPDLSHKNGKILKQTTFRITDAPERRNIKLQEEIFVYESLVLPVEVNAFAFGQYISSFCYFCDETKFGYNAYRLQPVLHRLKQKTAIQYDQNDENKSTVEATYFEYLEGAFPAHYSIVGRRSISSKGQEIETKLHRNSYTPALINEQEAFLIEGDVLKKISGKRIRYSGKLPSVIYTWNSEVEQYYKSVSFSYGDGKCLKETITPPSIFAEGAPQEAQDESETIQTASRPESESFYTSYLWGYENNYPIAKVENARNSQVAYTSFETPDKGNWRYTMEGVSQSEEGARGKVFQGDLSWTSVTAEKYKVTFWAKGSGTISITYFDGDIVLAGGELEKKSFTASESWQPIEWMIDMKENKGLQISSGSVLIDDVRLHPADAVMTTYTYFPGIGISSMVDSNLRATFYEYEGHNRLKRIKDHEGNILEEYTYHYMQ